MVNGIQAVHRRQRWGRMSARAVSSISDIADAQRLVSSPESATFLSANLCPHLALSLAAVNSVST